MIIRTVLDLRSNLPKYLLQTTLLAASWHRFARNTAGLEVLHIGSMSNEMYAWFATLGVQITSTQANPNDTFSKTSNTIQGAQPNANQPILLVDNDVAFTGLIDDLGRLPRNSIYGAVAGNFRVTPRQWKHIAKLGIAPATCSPQIPRTALVAALADRKAKPKPIDYSYVNGGVLLLPPDFDFQSLWQEQQRSIANAFASHHLSSGSVTQSNMAALATAIGSFGTFDWLPAGYNVRHADFALGFCPASDIRLVHMTGLGTRTQAENLSGWISDYWVIKMGVGLEKLRPLLRAEEYQTRIEQLHAVHANIQSTIDSYDLDILARTLLSTASAVS